jgi:hypothetical protein
MSIQTLSKQLVDLREVDAHYFDPLQFSYIEGLLGRAQQARAPVGKILQAKADRLLIKYLADRSALQIDVAECLGQCQGCAPESIEALYLQYRRGDYRAVKEGLKRLLEPATKSKTAMMALAELVTQLDNVALSQSLAINSIDEQLLEQEEQVLQKSAFFQVGREAVVVDLAAGKPALRSTQKMQRHMQERSLERRVELALAEAPESPGPLNPQMLAIKALSNMRDLSPDYLSRFVAYLDTLFWLEQADGGTASQKNDKKPARSSGRRKPSKK